MRALALVLLVVPTTWAVIVGVLRPLFRLRAPWVRAGWAPRRGAIEVGVGGVVKGGGKGREGGQADRGESEGPSETLRPEAGAATTSFHRRSH